LIFVKQSFLCIWLSTAILLLLSSCALLPSDQSNHQQTMPIAKPTGPSRRVVQQISGTWADRTESMLVILELDSKRIAMVGLSNDGLSLFNWRYDGDKVVSDTSLLLPQNIDPNYMVADMQLSYWPVDALKSSLIDGWRLETQANKRILYFNNTKRAEVTYLEPDADWPRSIELINYQYHYRLQIKTLSYDLIPE